MLLIEFLFKKQTDPVLYSRQTHSIPSKENDSTVPRISITAMSFFGEGFHYLPPTTAV